MELDLPEISKLNSPSEQFMTLTKFLDLGEGGAHGGSGGVKHIDSGDNAWQGHSKVDLRASGGFLPSRSCTLCGLSS